MKNTFVTLTLITCILFACNNSKDSAANESTATSDSITENEITNVSETPGQIPSADNSTPISIDAATTSQQQPTASTAAGMNPAHGQPGHRCEIAVGAPLNSAPAAKNAAPIQVTNTATPSITTTPAPATITSAPASPAATAAPVKTAPGMNPPHGEPGHDCAIAVGAPLKK